MKKIIRAAGGCIFLVTVLLSCSQSKNIPTAEQLNRKWMLKTLTGISNEQVLSAAAYVDLSDLKKTGGKAGCNHIFFTTRLEGNSAIQFVNMGSTKMYCKNYMEVEDAYIAALGSIVQYEIKGHHIQFKNKAGVVVMQGVAADWD